jgi:hypothetical protein
MSRPRKVEKYDLIAMGFQLPHAVILDISSAFSWDDTPEGHEYWEACANGQISKYEYLDKICDMLVFYIIMHGGVIIEDKETKERTMVPFSSTNTHTNIMLACANYGVDEKTAKALCSIALPNNYAHYKSREELKDIIILNYFKRKEAIEFMQTFYGDIIEYYD